MSRRLVYTAFSAGPATFRAEHAIVSDKALFEDAAREVARAAVKPRRAAADRFKDTKCHEIRHAIVADSPRLVSNPQPWRVPFRGTSSRSLAVVSDHRA